MFILSILKLNFVCHAEEILYNRQDIQLLHLDEGRIQEDCSVAVDNRVESYDFLLFPLSLVFEATQHFSQENKLGEGGFGSVYRVIIV